VVFLVVLGRFLFATYKRIQETVLREIVRIDLTVNSRGKLVDFEQAVAGAAVSTFQHGRVISR
jgi:hypothetical protein